MIQPYAGGSKGGYFRPEIDDEVLIGFEGGSAERPYVMGANYNGKDKPEFFDPKNMTKWWKLKFGQLFKFIEKMGIWLSDPSGNELHLDTENKNINLTSLGTVTIRAKNIIFEASESITSNATMNISETAGVDKTTTVGAVLNTTVAGDNILNVKGTFLEHIEGDHKSHTEKERQETSEQGIASSSNGAINKHSEKEIQNNSGEKSKSH